MVLLENPDIDQIDDTCLRPSLLESVIVSKQNDQRTVLCFCGTTVTRSIVPHMKKCHAEIWLEWAKVFVELRGIGYSMKKIMRLFEASNGELLFSWTVIEREIRNLVESGEASYSPPPIMNVKEWEPSEFELESTTVWDFPTRGSWAVHTSDYRGNWPPQLVRNLILKYTDPGDLILDPFMGGGTTLIEAWLLERNSIGIDISTLAYTTVETRLCEMQDLSVGDDRISIEEECRPDLTLGDATLTLDDSAYSDIEPSSVKLLCVHPPYLDALKYTGGNELDLSTVSDLEEFLERMSAFADGCADYLTQDSTCAVLIGDVRRRGELIPLGARVLDVFLDLGYELDATIIKLQHRERSSEFYSSSTQGYLLAHEYLHILKWQ